MGKKQSIISLFVAAGICIAGAQTTLVNLTGIVNDASSGNPIAGATVTLANNPSLTTTSSADGSFRLSGEATVGIRSHVGMDRSGMSLTGSELYLSVMENNTPIVVEVFNFKSERMRTILNQKVSAGRYNVNVAASGLSGGLYIVRARMGNQTAAFKMTALGSQPAFGNPFRTAAFARSPLAKAAADAIDDTLKVTKAGYRMSRKAITVYNTLYPVLMAPSLPAGDLKIVSERGFPQVDWGSNVEVQVWDASTQLNGAYKPAPFEGAQSWMVTFKKEQPYNAWGFVAKQETPEDMSAWKGGTMHLAVKGTANTIGVTMASANQIPGFSVKVDLSEYGYQPDGQWHEALVPLDKFEGTDLSQISVYCGLVYPLMSDTVAFNPSLFYQVDDIYWSLKK